MDRPNLNGLKPLPSAIGIRTDELAPLLLKWRKRNPHVPWKILVMAGLRRELAPLAGKRHAHLVNGRGRREAA